MTRYNYSKLKNTWSDGRQPTYKINSYTDPTSTGLVVFDIDDTLRVVDLAQYSNCQWRTDCKFPNNTLADTQKRAVNAINTFYGMGYDIAIYTKEQTSELAKSGGYKYVSGLSQYINDPYKTKFTQDILVNYEKNIMFGTGTKYGTDKGKGLIKLADILNIPHNKVLMFDDTNANINDITRSGICGINVSNTPNICGISDQNLSDGITFMNSGQCINTNKPNPCPGPGACAPPPKICTFDQSCADGSCTCPSGSRCDDYGKCCSPDCTNVFCDQRNECGETCGCGEGQYCDGYRRCLPCKTNKDCAFMNQNCNTATGECVDKSFSNFNY